MRIGKWIGVVVLVAVTSGALIWFVREARKKHLAWSDLTVFFWRAPGLPLPDGRGSVEGGTAVRFVGFSKYLNGARAVVTHTIDDSTKYVPAAIGAMDKYGIKATIFVSTERKPIADLWPVLRRAVENGHEIGSHSRTHPCLWPPTLRFCFFAYSDWELAGSRDDILRETKQPHVWSFAYPCGLCAGYDFIHRKLERAGYLVARNYPNEAAGGHNVPDMQTYDPDVYNATYTQVVQKKGGIAPSGRTDVAEVNRKFDEVYENGGIYNFLSHPQWLEYGPEGFYEQHLKYLANRPDIWYVPMGPLYGYRRVLERTRVRRVGEERFALECDLPKEVFPFAVTLEFAAGPEWTVEGARREGEKLLVTVQPGATVSFRKLRN